MILIIFILLSACYGEDGKHLNIRKVFECPPETDGDMQFAGEHYYYLYNYKSSDISELLSFAKKIKFPEDEADHFYYFYRYHSSLPDTNNLQKKMVLKNQYDLEKEPGSLKNKDYLILGISSLKAEVLNEKYYPRRVIFTKFINGKHEESYFHRDSLSGNLYPATYSQMFPCIKCE
ncbi:hypothetical protein RCC89_14660 [Cytophagaceae bacterium ABcell3]|nr:hypothetical protein RCC89_14660 [Cytophagaceae bacterium ABcell3]